MSGGNGKRRPPRPRIEMVSAAPPEEAAAVVAAVEQFLVEPAPAPAATRSTVNPWQRAGLLEGVDSGPGPGGSWGEGRAWGERPDGRA